MERDGAQVGVYLGNTKVGSLNCSHDKSGGGERRGRKHATLPAESVT